MRPAGRAVSSTSRNNRPAISRRDTNRRATSLPDMLCAKTVIIAAKPNTHARDMRGNGMARTAATGRNPAGIHPAGIPALVVVAITTMVIRVDVAMATITPAMTVTYFPVLVDGLRFTSAAAEAEESSSILVAGGPGVLRVAVQGPMPIRMRIPARRPTSM